MKQKISNTPLLQNYFYLTSSHGVLGWVANAQQGADLLRSHYPAMTDTETATTLYTFRTCYKYFNNPIQVDERRGAYLTGNDYDLTADFRDDDPRILCYFSPMMFRGFSARLATIKLQGDEVYVVRVSQEQAMPLDAYAALIQHDIASMDDRTIANLFREQGPRRIQGTPHRPHGYVLQSGDWLCPLSEISPAAVEQALNEPLDTPAAEAILAVQDLRQLVPLGRVTEKGETLWMHHRTHAINVGRYANSHGLAEQQYVRCGSILSGIFSNLPGKSVMTFTNAGTDYVIKLC